MCAHEGIRDLSQMATTTTNSNNNDHDDDDYYSYSYCYYYYYYYYCYVQGLSYMKGWSCLWIIHHTRALHWSAPRAPLERAPWSCIAMALLECAARSCTMLEMCLCQGQPLP